LPSASVFTADFISYGNNNSSTTSITLEQASEHIVLDRRTLTLLFSLETEYLAIGEQGGRTTRVDKHNMIVATAATCAHQRD